MRVERCSIHPDCSTHTDKGVVSHVRNHPDPESPWPPEKTLVDYDPDFGQGLANLISSVEKVGKQLKELKPEVYKTRDSLATSERETAGRLDRQALSIGAVEAKAAGLGNDQSTLKTKHRALNSLIEQQGLIINQLRAEVELLRVESRQTNSKANDLGNVITQSLKLVESRTKEYEAFAALRTDLTNVQNLMEKERSERLDATRKFMRSVSQMQEIVAEQ